MKSVIIASDHSGGGKTTFTLGLMKAIKDRNIDVQGYKVGPDYIDTAFHSEVTEKPGRNLDVFLMGEEGVKYNYLCGNGDVGIIEGVMGLYDGIGSSTRASTYDVSRVLDNMPIILVLSPKGVSITICALINGLKSFKNANIKGIVLNNVSEKYYKLLKYEIEKNTDIKVFGYLPKDEEISLKSRHLGLVQSSEVEDLNKKVSKAAELINRYVDVEGIMNIMKEFKCNADSKEAEIKKFIDDVKSIKSTIKIGVAYDKAFSFYYENNIELLKKIGEVVYFSPLNDKEIPKDLDFLYIGGGYPEVFKEKLAENKLMKKSIKEALDNGLVCYAECGGLMYLTSAIDGCSMTGFFDGQSYMTKRLNNFGYCSVTLKNEDKEIKINAHEFHKSYVELNEKTVYEVSKMQYDDTVISWKCGYIKNNTLGAYPHINFMNNLSFLKEILFRIR